MSCRLDVVNLSKRKGEEKSRWILRDISFGVHDGEIVAVMGPSGAGKSTLLRLINLLEEPDGGKVLLSGKDVRSIEVTELRRKVALVLQEPVVFDGTVADNLRYPLLIAGRRIDDEEGFFGELLGSVRLPVELLERDAERLSVGERQRLCIARALVNEPSVLMLDEPTSALDPTAAKTVLQLLRTLAEEKRIATVLVSHIPEHAEVADRVVVLIDGRVAAEGELEHLRKECDDESVRRFFSGELT